jgi:hypothetical protein
MSSPIRHLVTLAAVTLAIGFVTGAAFLVSAHDGSLSGPDVCMTTGSGLADEGAFLAENDAAMMVSHHQGAIDMAIAVLRFGRNAQIKRLAQEIIVTQQQEIAAMRLAVGQPLPPSVPSPNQVPPTRQTDPKSSRPTDLMKEP